MNFNFHLFDKIRKHTKTLNMTLKSVEKSIKTQCRACFEDSVFFQRWCPVADDMCPRLSEFTQG